MTKPIYEAWNWRPANGHLKDMVCRGSLRKIVKVVSQDWQRSFNHPIYFVETFVDTNCFRGSCYQAANWIYLGQTSGRGKNDQTFRVNRSIKAVWGYPLSRHFREVLQHG